MSTNWDLNQETMTAENLLYQRLIIFLIVFSLFVIGAINTQRKILFISILALGVIICWVLTFIVIRTAKRIDNKSGGKLVRLILGYLVPIFCSGLLTVALFFGSLGYVDSYLFPTTLKSANLENKIDQLKEAVVKQISPPKKNSSANFKNVDSVIAESKVIRSGKKIDDLKSLFQIEKSVAPKQISDSKNIKKGDSVLVNGKPATGKSSLLKSKTQQVPVPKPGKSSKIFKDIDSVISKEK